MSLQDLRRRINSIKTTSKITSAMKMVAAAKFKRLQTDLVATRSYFKIMESIGSNLGQAVHDMKAVPIWLSQALPSSNLHVCIAMGAKRGLCGNFNALTIKAASQYLEANPNAKFIAIGNKLKTSLNTRFVGRMLDLPKELLALEDQPENYFSSLIVYLESLKKEGSLEKLILVHTKFVNPLVQLVKILELLPIKWPLLPNDSKEDKIFIEPNVEDFFKSFIGDYLQSIIFAAYMETQCGELATRMTAMDNATRNAKEMLKKLSLRYNRTRQAKITTELIEIIAGCEGAASS